MYFVKSMFDILSPKWDEHISGGNLVKGEMLYRWYIHIE